MISAAHQAAEFFLCLGLGAASSAVYLIGRLLYLRLTENRIIEFLLDLCFVAGVSAAFYALVLRVNYGQTLYYHVAAYLIGFLLPRILLIKLYDPLVKGAKKLYDAIQKAPFINKLFK